MCESYFKFQVSFTMIHRSPSVKLSACGRSPENKKYSARNSLLQFSLQIMTWVKIALTQSLLNNISDMFDMLLCIPSNQILIIFYKTSDMQWLSLSELSNVVIDAQDLPLIILVFALNFSLLFFISRPWHNFIIYQYLCSVTQFHCPLNRSIIVPTL